MSIAMAALLEAAVRLPLVMMIVTVTRKRRAMVKRGRVHDALSTISREYAFALPVRRHGLSFDEETEAANHRVGENSFVTVRKELL